MTVLRKTRILKRPKKQDQAAVTATIMFLKKAWTLKAVKVLIFYCLKILESKVNDICESTNTLRENQIKGEKQLTDLSETVNFLIF